MKISKAFSLLAVAAALGACGGGGDEAGDAAEMSVIPSDFTWTVSSCGGRQFSADTVHTINGGQPPFRINVSDPDIFEIGIYEISGGVRRYVPLTLRGDGFVELRGKDPQFVVVTRFGRGCVDPAVITVLDSFSTAVPIEYTIEVEEAATPAP